jgi:hypothetical protein
MERAPDNVHFLLRRGPAEDPERHPCAASPRRRLCSIVPLDEAQSVGAVDMRLGDPSLVAGLQQQMLGLLVRLTTNIPP